MLAGFGGLAAVALWPAAETARAQGSDPFAALKAKFARPTFVPQPADNLPTPARIALGRRLFADKQLSATGTVACASCHDATLSFTDGEVKGKGITGKPLERHTPTLWNVAFAPLLFWDGRAASSGSAGALSRGASRRDGQQPGKCGLAPGARMTATGARSTRPFPGTRQCRLPTSPRRWRPSSAR